MPTHEAYLGSDAFALAPFTNRVAYLEDGDVAVVAGPEVAIFDAEGRPANREIKITTRLRRRWWTRAATAISWRRKSTSSPKWSATRWPIISIPPGPIVRRQGDGPARCAGEARTRLTISACGTAYYAGLVGKYWFEKLARLPVEADVASELRYRDPVYPKDGAALFVSQSGETADTLAALRDAKAQGPDHHRDRQCAGKLHRARSRYRAADLCRAGDRRRLDQGLHLPVGGAGRASPSRRARRAARSSEARREDGSAPRCWKRRATSSEFLKQEAKIEALGEEIAKARDVLYIGRGAELSRWRWKAR